MKILSRDCKLEDFYLDYAKLNIYFLKKMSKSSQFAELIVIVMELKNFQIKTPRIFLWNLNCILKKRKQFIDMKFFKTRAFGMTPKFPKQFYITLHMFGKRRYLFYFSKIFSSFNQFLCKNQQQGYYHKYYQIVGSKKKGYINTLIDKSTIIKYASLWS
ncbi:unnamed protein product [Paramecium sonneborni]|uniref:Uncharacterized protein n=1 Tax=Paramecium sonneborni TaxID=65129 RepID=A0A8S1M5C0_9CILI|nr:unnamed protein product [Paramecium sonneborni]